MGLFGNWSRRRTLKKAHLPEVLWHRVVRSLPFLRGLSADEFARLRELAILFLAQKEMHGAHGFTLSDEIRLSIAIQACLPVMNLGLDLYAGWVGIIVYPGEFRVHGEEMDEHGVMHSYSDELSGEAWPGGPVILSWQDAGMTDAGYNVVIHEFAHKIHMRLGSEDRFPPPRAGQDASRWEDVWEDAYQRFCAEVDADEPTIVDPYAAEHPAEFFAVMSEEFFTDSGVLAREYPELYRELARFYRQDPAGVLPGG
ncbi:MAG: zinc-dependent peptidase [Betaproteobacteria bacterium]|nr:zinc-dependent peptidase [Betaproteobacteria bacterium]